MSTASAWASLVVIFVSVLILALPWLLSHLRRLAQILGRIRDLSQEGAYPVFSAETTDGREAEYITDRLVPKVPRWGNRCRLLGSRTMGGSSVTYTVRNSALNRTGRHMPSTWRASARPAG